MGEVVLFIDETKSDSRISRCRICHEEEAESSFEAPCACSGTVKFVHRVCIQRWCDEKGNTTCEICLQEYTPGYSVAPKQFRFVEAAVTIRDSLQIRRRENERRRRRRREIADSPECNPAAADRCVSCCRSLVLTLSAVLLIKQAFHVIYGIGEYPFSVLTVLVLKALGILLPILIIVRTIAALQKVLRLQYPESEDDSFTSDEEEDEQHRHLAQRL
ncbi:PREDICTED: uncharacterized protein LOC104825940 [Tarenaya hassleriana]|uniref:uncharacterized protein LOC104825940 n=1 Tax=Tarenaya hassleriana TaxID=28532 RepID=UPI00053C7564|nr:PREDICTED: uncharacterized protein LOC104825940 [Tarenaya hassleriana]